jgi:hypothetical protein
MQVADRPLVYELEGLSRPETKVNGEQKYN